MIAHDSNWIVEAPVEAVWAVVHRAPPVDRRASFADPRVQVHNNVRIEIVAEGDENGQGLVRCCWYEVPWYVGGRARSWEIVSEVRPPVYKRYDVLFCTPPPAKAKGWFRLEDLGDGRTRVRFHEEFAMEQRWLAPLIERRVHRFISRDNDRNMQNMIEAGLAARQAGTAA